jgi:hypothetical protein
VSLVAAAMRRAGKSRPDERGDGSLFAALLLPYLHSSLRGPAGIATVPTRDIKPSR